MTRRLIMAAAVMALCAGARADEWSQMIGQTDQVTQGLVAYYSMRNSGTTVFDEWGGNNGTIIGGLELAYSNGVVGIGAYLPSSNNYVEISDKENLSFGDGTQNAPFSILLWVWMADDNHSETIRLVSKNGTNISDSGNAEYKLEVTVGNKFRLWMRDDSVGAFSIRTSSSSIPSAGWHFVVATKGNLSGSLSHSDINLYLNGNNNTDAASGLTEAAFVAMENTPGKIRLGITAHATNTRLFRGWHNGFVDEVRIYNRALSPDEIRQLYRMGATPRRIKE
jgi:hypothetical protein